MLRILTLLWTLVDSRTIHPPRGGRREAARRQQSAIRRQVPAASVEVVTDQAPIEGDSQDPSVILAESPQRRSAVVYYPTTDPATGAANSDPVWITGDASRTVRPFPLEPGAQIATETAGWLYGWTTTAANPTLYVLEEND